MGIEDINISETLETNAPSIKYSGNEGPKSPEEERMMAQKMAAAMEDQAMADEQMMSEDEMMAGVDYSSRAFREKLIGQLMDAGGLDYGSASVEADRIIEIKLRPKRTKAAFGGIMGMDGRRQYGLGSKFKKFVRKIIPNEVADIAVKAAPFVAPFNPLAAGLMSGIGGFDRTGRIGSSIKSGLMNYGMGQLARGIGGGRGNLQGNPFKAGSFKGAFQVPGGGQGFGKYFSSPIQKTGGLGEILADRANQTSGVTEKIADGLGGDFEVSGGALKGTGGKNINSVDRLFNRAEIIKDNPLSKAFSKISEYVPKSFGALNPLGENFDIKQAVGALGIFKVAEKLLGGPEQAVDDIMDRGEGLDIAGIRAEVTEAFKDQTGEKLSALRVKYPYLGTQRSKNQAAMAMGGRIGYMGGGMTMGDPRMMAPQSQMPMMAPQSRMPAAEGGLMDLGGMEKDYRAEGGFVPIGAKEKADDVPARLSVNEFVFTADAVRSAGGGDIDRGAEVMENMMKNLEQGGQVSEESQGMSGAQQMFETSERLSEVV